MPRHGRAPGRDPIAGSASRPGPWQRLVALLPEIVVGAAALVTYAWAVDGEPQVGLAAGLALVASATASRYAQEARSFALVAASTLALVQATGATVYRHRSTLRWRDSRPGVGAR